MATGRRSSKRQKNKIPIYSSTKLKRRSATTLVDQKDKQQYKCDVCGKIYYSRYHYHNHLKQYDYTQEEVSLSIKDIECFKCVFCLKKFNGLIGLIEHLQTSHIKNRFKCCNTIFGNIDLLKNHINRNHDKEFKCDVCEKTFSKRHEREHHIDSAHRKISRCQICSNKFDSAKNLQIHLHFVHEGWEYNTCEECNSIFTRPNNFFSHLNDAHVHKE